MSTSQNKASRKTRFAEKRTAQLRDFFANGRSATLCAATLLYIAGISSAQAQTGSCGLTAVIETSKATYSPIGRAAHVEGTIVLLVRFRENGEPLHVTYVSGPALLQGAAIDFVQHWQVNPYTGPRECPVAMQYRLTGPVGRECDASDTTDKPYPVQSERLDPQHYRLTAENGCVTVMRDPAPLKVHSFFGYHWYSKL
jgi:Gram-negative bacterial TonB protein C-terminal